MQEYIYKIIMNNGKEYTVKSHIQYITEFIEFCVRKNTIQDFKLAQTYIDKNGVTYNTVMIKLDDISSWEYATA